MAAFVLIAHGSRNPKFQQIVMRVAEKLEDKVGKVYVGFLMGKPSVKEAIAKASEENDELIIVPFFIAEGSHVVQDLRKTVEEIAKDKRVKFAKALGDHPLIVEALYQRYEEALRE